jgi:uncharacterized protein (DUF58 family)
MNHLPPDIFARVASLELRARRIVDGFLAGGHRSPRHGFSVEFAQHRDYVPGDDIRHIDWKVYGRTGRHFLKQHELETSLTLWLLLDASESMTFASADVSKYGYACLLAAALALLATRQGDSFCLARFDDEIRSPLKPTNQPGRLREALHALGDAPGDRPSRVGHALRQFAERAGRRGVVIVLSDLFDEPSEILEGLRHPRFRDHDVAVFHVLDPAEIEFPYRQATLFKGLENLPDALTDPLAIRAGYLAELRSFFDQLETGCRDLRTDYIRLPTDRHAGEALARYLTQRGGDRSAS